jgi:NAD(P)-dependent dehydrogenase (short-subunit alcohol dehydrogenase family)
MRLKDKVILVTGSTTGIGAGMARRFVAEGARVIVHGRNAERGHELCQELRDENTAFCQGDLGEAGYPERLANDALAAFGRIDGLVNNAGLVTRSTFVDTDAAFFDRIMAVNARAPMLLIRALLPALKESQGSVLNIGSILAWCGVDKLLAYSMSKGAMMTMTRNLADSLGSHQVRVNQLNVGWTLTENEYEVMIQDGLPENWPDNLPPHAAPSGRILSPADIAAAAVYWVGDESAPVSGTVAELEQYPVLGRLPNVDGAS